MLQIDRGTRQLHKNKPPDSCMEECLLSIPSCLSAPVPGSRSPSPEAGAASTKCPRLKLGHWRHWPRGLRLSGGLSKGSFVTRGPSSWGQPSEQKSHKVLNLFQWTAGKTLKWSCRDQRVLSYLRALFRLLYNWRTWKSYYGWESVLTTTLCPQLYFPH